MNNDPSPRFSRGTFSEKSWEMAIAFADSVGKAPSSIQVLVRNLLGDEQVDVDTDEPNRESVQFLRRFLKSPAFKAPYFQAVELFRAEMIGAADEPFIDQDFIDSFSCLEHAIISSLMFMHRSAVRGADAVSMREATKRLQRGLNLGWFVGNTLKSIGPGVGMLVGGVRWLGLLPIARHDGDGFKSYLTDLDTSSPTGPIPDVEEKTWGCSSVQIGLLMLQRFGFSATHLVPLMRALTTCALRLPSEPFERSCYAADAWIRNMVDPSFHPSIPLPPTFYLAKDGMDEIQRRVFAASKRGVANWLTALSEHLTPETAPQLFCSEEADNGPTLEEDLFDIDYLKD